MSLWGDIFASFNEAANILNNILYRVYDRFPEFTN